MQKGLKRLKKSERRQGSTLASRLLAAGARGGWGEGAQEVEATDWRRRGLWEGRTVWFATGWARQRTEHEEGEAGVDEEDNVRHDELGRLRRMPPARPQATKAFVGSNVRAQHSKGGGHVAAAAKGNEEGGAQPTKNAGQLALLCAAAAV